MLSTKQSLAYILSPYPLQQTYKGNNIFSIFLDEETKASRG